MSLPDYTTYLDDHMTRTEQDWLANPEIHNIQLEAVVRAMKLRPVSSILEIGCGAGHLAALLPDVKYTGFDKSELALDLAKDRKSGTFIQGDIRTAILPHADLVLCFSFMKHFNLDEWYITLGKVMSQGDNTLFDIPVANKVYDEGVEFPHLWVTEKYLKACLSELGKKPLFIDKSRPEWIVLC